jgi:hypothetical protein
VIDLIFGQPYGVADVIAAVRVSLEARRPVKPER